MNGELSFTWMLVVGPEEEEEEFDEEGSVPSDGACAPFCCPPKSPLLEATAGDAGGVDSAGKANPPPSPPPTVDIPLSSDDAWGTFKLLRCRAPGWWWPPPLPGGSAPVDDRALPGRLMTTLALPRGLPRPMRAPPMRLLRRTVIRLRVRPRISAKPQPLTSANRVGTISSTRIVKSSGAPNKVKPPNMKTARITTRAKVSGYSIDERTLSRYFGEQNLRLAALLLALQMRLPLPVPLLQPRRRRIGELGGANDGEH